MGLVVGCGELCVLSVVIVGLRFRLGFAVGGVYRWGLLVEYSI